MVVYIYKYSDNPDNKNPWKDPWILNPNKNDFHAIRASGGCKGTWTYVPRWVSKGEDDSVPRGTPNPNDPDSYWRGNVPKQRYCCCKSE